MTSFVPSEWPCNWERARLSVLVCVVLLSLFPGITQGQCNDGLDNDNDGLIDHPLDPGCSSPTDPDEVNSRSTQCSDGIDNDGDGAIDYPSDSGCSSHSDNDESEWDQSCRLSRQIVLQNVLPVSHQLASDSFSQETCNQDCMRYTIGKSEDDTWSLAQGCGTVNSTVNFTVHRPDRISTVRLIDVGYDDYTSVRVNGQLVWSDPVGWTGGANGKPGCVENFDARTVSFPHGRFRNRVDLTRFFQGTAPGGHVRIEQTTYYRGEGEGWLRLQVQFLDRCVVGREHIAGDCSSLDRSPVCTLRKEVVDGVTTVDEYRTTGSRQGWSGKTLTDGDCTRNIRRSWWEKERIYSCTGDRTGKSNLPACADGDDNDGDGDVDYPHDDGCGSYGDPSEDSEGCTQTGSCVCGSGSDADGLVDVRSDLAICQNLSGRLVCPTDRQQCTRQHFAVWNPSGAGAVEQRQDWVCPAGVEYGCGHDPTDGNVYCSSRPCVNASAPVVTEHDSAGDWPEDRPENIRTDGTCSGRFQIFGGSAKRCRKRGVSTGYQNCCRNRLPPLSDRTGAPGEPNQREYREQHTAIEFWENQCDPEDQESALLNASGYCIFLGTYCSKKWKWIGCVQKSKSFCCYNSHLAALVHEQVKTVPDDFGPLRRPHCRGFTPEEFQGLDFSKIDLSAYFDSVEMKSGQKIQEQLRTTVRDSRPP